MYLAPLNYDRFFKKVFSHTHIAKAFLEDFLDEKIDEITPLPLTNRITDSSEVISFDFRCKIKDRYLIVDMQQWYKQDVVKRFYLYHCASTVLQLESLKHKKSLLDIQDKRTSTLDYLRIEPVLTLIWMVSDNLDFTDNVVTFTTLPENVQSLVMNDQLWQTDSIDILLEERKKVMKVLGNRRKHLHFLYENKLVFMFQSNIVKQLDLMQKYYRWFVFAEKTRKKENKKEDFQEFDTDPVFHEVMDLIAKERLDELDVNYILTEQENFEQFNRFVVGLTETIKEDIREDVKLEVMDSVREEVIEEVKESVREEVIEEVKESVRGEVIEEVKESVRGEVIEEVKESVREEVKTELLNFAQTQNIRKLYFDKQKTVAEIADLLDIAIEEIENAIK